MAALANLRNYESMESQKDEATVEIGRYSEKGFVKVMTLEQVHSRYSHCTAS